MVDALDSAILRDPLRRFLRPRQGVGGNLRRASVLAVVTGKAGEAPAHGAVAQRHHLVRHAGIDQRLRADDAAGAAGAIDHHHSIRRRRDIAHAQHQLRAGYVGGGWDRYARIFVERATVEHDEIGFFAQQAFELLRRDIRRVICMLDEFTECLAWNVDAGEQLEAGRCPGIDAAIENRHISVAVARKDRCSAPGKPVIVVAEHNARRTAGHQLCKPQLEPAQRDRACEQQVALRKDQLLADIDERKLAALPESWPGGRRD